MFGWLKKHWKTIATVAVATVVFVGVTVLTGGLGAPAMVALLAGGVASGVAGSVTANLLDGKPVSVKDALIQGVVSGVITVATAGLGNVLAPVVSRALAPVIARTVPAAAAPFITATVTNGTVGATLGAGTQVAQNALTGRPLGENVGPAALLTGVTGTLIEPLKRILPAARPASETRLVHLTSETGHTGINTTGQLNGRNGIFAVPETALGQPTAVRVLRTGVMPSTTTHGIPLPAAANAHFRQPIPIGPYSLIKRLGGVRFAPAGSIDIVTGAYKGTGSLVGPRTLIYGPDILNYTVAGTILGVTKAVAGSFTSSPPPPPPPQLAKSVGITKALGEAAK